MGIGLNFDLDFIAFFELDFVAVGIGKGVGNANLTIEMIGPFDADLRFLRFPRFGVGPNYLLDLPWQSCAGFRVSGHDLDFPQMPPQGSGKAGTWQASDIIFSVIQCMDHTGNTVGGQSVAGCSSPCLLISPLFERWVASDPLRMRQLEVKLSGVMRNRIFNNKT